MTNAYSPAIPMLLSQAPNLLMYMIGLALCVAWWRRCPRAAMLAFAGTLLLAFSSLVLPIVQVYIFNTQALGSTRFGQLLTILSLVASLVRGVGFILLVLAVFSERARVGGPAGFPVGPPPTPMRL